MYSRGESTPRRHKKHKKDKYDECKYGSSSGQVSSVSSGNARLKLILKVGGSSTPEHSDSPGPAMSHIVSVPYDDDSNSALSYSQIRKAKKKEKKKKKDKKHKHHKEKRRREREEMGMSIMPISVVPIPMEPDSASDEIMLNLNSSNLKQENEESLMLVEEESEVMETPVQSSSPVGIRLDLVEIPKSQQQVLPMKPKIFDRIPLQKMLDHILRLIQKKDSHQVFSWPVTDKIAPGYFTIISKPMDFSTMRSKVDRGEYDTLMEFKEDFILMCNNAMKYNHVDTVYYKTAKKLLQNGCKLLDTDKIRSLIPVIPIIRTLHEEQLGFPLFLEQEPIIAEVVSQSEEEMNDSFCLDPTKSIHYVPPHPNDPPDPCGAFTEDLMTEEVLQQARLAAREAAHRLAMKKPNSKMGFLRMKEDGSTSLAILTPSNGVLPGTREQPVSLGLLTGKLTHGTTQLQAFRGEDKKSYARTSKPLNYGSFSSFAPNHDSTFAGLTPDEQELVQATYGDDTAVQYSDSVIEFAKGCDYAMRMVDEILNTLTKGEHARTVSLIEERKKMDEEDEALRRLQEAYDQSIREEWKFVESMGLPESSTTDDAGAIEDSETIDFVAIKSLEDIGIDTKFVDDLKSSCVSSTNGKLEETAVLIENLEKLQNERLSLATIPVPPYVQPPSENEVQLADRVTENLIDLVKQTVPGCISSAATLHQAMGIDLNAFAYQAPPPSSNPHGPAGGSSGNVISRAEEILGQPQTEVGNCDVLMQQHFITTTGTMGKLGDTLMMVDETPDAEMEVEIPSTGFIINQ